MTGWNLPPGCEVTDLPGSTPEDVRHDRIKAALDLDCLTPTLDKITDWLKATGPECWNQEFVRHVMRWMVETDRYEAYCDWLHEKADREGWYDAQVYER